ncbi:MAG: GHKL domain-containing protein [Clostridia bacterium]|nr:GHKL domain-containing protein [Clostridia bacterium]
MLLIADLIRKSTVIFALISSLDNLVLVAGCAFFAVSLFHLSVRRRALPLLGCAALCVICGIVSPLTVNASDFVQFLWSVAELALPFVCMALLFPRRGLWKAMLTVAGYAFVEAVRFLILLVGFGFDNEHRDDALELLVGFLVDVAAFLLAYLFLTRYTQRHAAAVNVTRGGAVLFLLMTASTAVFVTTLLLIASAYSETRQTEFAFMLMNIPMLTATVSYAAVRFFRMRNESENNKKQLQMQIQQYEWMEHMVEDVRMFRHDFPKKMRPLIAYLDENRPDDARALAEQFSDFVSGTGERFHTGNYRLDTVLFCEQQIAQRACVRLDVPFDTAFPKAGVDPDDIYTIFPNALDNAIEAAAQTDGDKVVTLRTHRTKQTVYITIRNPYKGDVKLKNGLPQTSKADKRAHGYGLRSIKKAAAKYGSDNVTFTAKDGVFELQIYLNLPADAPTE